MRLLLLLLAMVFLGTILGAVLFATATITEPQPLFIPSPEHHRRIATLAAVKESLIEKGESFIEVNIPAMKVRVWKQGTLELEVPIALVGDPQEWGGTASGLYSVRSLQEVKYSSIAEVYMPWAIHFYGKYFIHGEPYYYSGNKRITEATGGCIQLTNKDAEKIFEAASAGMPLLVIDQENDDKEFQKKNAAEFPSVSASNYLVADLDSGFVFAERNAKELWPIASLTKLMETLTIAENADLRSAITVQPFMLDPYGSTQEIRAGSRFRVVELMIPALTESSNDAAQALSYFLGNSTTIALMNNKAKALQMNNTSFVDVHGLSEQNVSTAEDLLLLARAATYDRPLLWDITNNKEVRSFGSVKFRDLKNKNIFTEDQLFVGGKTGFIKASGYNGMFVFRLAMPNGEERRIAIIELGAESYLEGEHGLKQDTEAILRWLQNTYF